MENKYKINVDISENLLLNDFNQLNDDYLFELRTIYFKHNKKKNNKLITNNLLKDYEKILKNLYCNGYMKPWNIQKYGIPFMLWRRDCLLQEKSGQGKTIWYVLSWLLNITTLEKTNVLIIAPTKELANQIYDIYVNITKNLDVSIALHVGGTNIVDYKKNNNYTNFNEMVVIGTPGRIMDIIKKSKINLDYLQCVILDECDNLLQDSFNKSMVPIINSIYSHVQIILISATITDDINNISDNFTYDKISILLNDFDINLKNISQYFIYNQNEESKISLLHDVLSCFIFDQCIIYCNKIDFSVILNKELLNNNFDVLLIHSNMTNVERNNIMKKFYQGNQWILITTDLLARGIDLIHVSLVINFDMPTKNDIYIHRIGRTGRFGKRGDVINFVNNLSMKFIKQLKDTYSFEIVELNLN